MARKRRAGRLAPSNLDTRPAKVCTNEIAIAEELYRAARAHVEEHGAVRLEGVKVAVGELLRANPVLLRAAWGFVVQESVDAGSQIDVQVRSAHYRCTHCGDVPHLDHVLPRFCPVCHRAVQVTGGSELQLLQVDFAAEVLGLATDGVRH